MSYSWGTGIVAPVLPVESFALAAFAGMQWKDGEGPGCRTVGGEADGPTVLRPALDAVADPVMYAGWNRSVWTVDVYLGPTVAMPAPRFLAELRRSRVLDGLVVSLGRGKAVGLDDIVHDGQEFTHGAEVLG